MNRYLIEFDSSQISSSQAALQPQTADQLVRVQPNFKLSIEGKGHQKVLWKTTSGKIVTTIVDEEFVRRQEAVYIFQLLPISKLLNQESSEQ